VAKKIKKYVDGGDIYEGTPLARAMGVRGVPEPGLEAVYPEQYMGGVGSIKGVGGSAMKAVAPKKAAKKAADMPYSHYVDDLIDDMYPSSDKAKIMNRFKANDAARQAEIDAYAKGKALEYAKDQQRMALKKANDTGKVYLSDAEKAAMGNKVNKFRLQEPPPAVRSLDDSRVLKRLEYKKGGAVKAKPKASSASKRADGIATKGKTRGRMI
jgi:hypothetical protein